MSAYISGVFGKSPFASIQEHVTVCVQATEELLNLIPAASKADWDTVNVCYDRISVLENDADTRKHDIRMNLPTGFFLPVARADLLELIGLQDGIANRSRDVAGIMTGRKMQFPAAIQGQLLDFVTSVVETCRQARDVVKELDELINAAFRGPEARQVLDMIEALEAAENHTDTLKIHIRAALFAIENDLPPVQVMFYYQTLDLIGSIADDAERVGHRVQLMLAK